ncbi:MAG: TRAP transporter small permease subunit [Geminicoccaceae bacterium]|nr:TRAP transporter small permease subunit [Geminicoccaceae bacterium]MCB9945903.1 TRAP transporter small permease subunit [Geminicoccaceae bacterium]
MDRPPARYGFEGVLASLAFIALLSVLLVQILGRTPLFNGPVWTEELARWIWVWMAFFAIGEAERTDSQLRMDFLAGFLPEIVRRAVRMMIDIVYLAISGHLVWIAWKTVLRTWNNESVTLPLSDAAMYAAALAGFVFVVHRVVRRLIRGCRRPSSAEGIRS